MHVYTHLTGDDGSDSVVEYFRLLPPQTIIVRGALVLHVVCKKRRRTVLPNGLAWGTAASGSFTGPSANSWTVRLVKNPCREV